MTFEKKKKKSNFCICFCEVDLFYNFLKYFSGTITGLSMNILCAGDKLPMQRGFPKNGMGSLLPALRFLGGLYNFCNFVIGRSTLEHIYMIPEVNSNWFEISLWVKFHFSAR